MASIAGLRDAFEGRHPGGDRVIGTGSLLWDGSRLVFALERRRHWTPTGSTVVIGYQGVGGELDPGESPVACLRREAREEATCELEVRDAPRTYRVADGAIETVTLDDDPAPVLVYEESYGDGDDRWHLFVATYQATVDGRPAPAAELPGLLWLTPGAFRRSADGIPAPALPSSCRLAGENVPADATLAPIFSASKLLEIAAARGWPDEWTA